MKSVEEYQGQTEERWRKLAEGKEALYCGWCEFVAERFSETLPPRDCSMCPVIHVFRQICWDIPQVRAFYDAPYSEEQEAAKAVLDLAIEYREELIAAAKAVLEEANSG